MRNRKTYNFAEVVADPAELDSAVATTNLISIMDPKEIDDEEVKVISDATGASSEFVEKMADLVDEAGESKEEPAVVSAKFSKCANEIIESFVAAKNFSAPAAIEPKSGEEKVLEVAQLTTLIDDKVLQEQPVAETAEVIAEATCMPQEVCEELVENAKEQFSTGKTFEIPEEVLANFSNYMENFGKLADIKDAAARHAKSGKLWVMEKGGKIVKAVGAQYQAHPKMGKVVVLVPAAIGAAFVAKKIHDKAVNHANPEATTQVILPEPVPALQPEVVVPATPLNTAPAAIAQPADAAKKADPTPGATPSDAKPAGEALKVESELATVTAAADIPAAETTFGRTLNAGQSKTNGLQNLLGDRFIPNKSK